MRNMVALVSLFVPALAWAKIDTTEKAMHCLTDGIAAKKDVKGCFTDAGWTNRDGGEGFVRQQARKGWSVNPDKAGPCCNDKVLWAKIILKKGDKVVDEVWLIFDKDAAGELKIKELTEKDPSKP